MTRPLPRFWLLAVALVAIGITGAYSNSLQNGFHLDDMWGITPNPYVRSLRFIPRYFVDPATYNTHAENTDYRPLTSTTYALNYAVSGYDPWSWHILNLLLHGIVCLSVVGLGQALFGTGRIVPFPRLAEPEGDLIALGTGLLFAVHPVTAGCANYMWARSSLLVAALIAPASVLYLQAIQRNSWSRALLATLLFGAALLSKEEAIAFFGVAALAEFLLAPSRQPKSLFARLLPRPGDLRLLPLLAVALGYLWVYLHVLPPNHGQNWANASTGRLQYLLTQTGAWWYYVGKVLLPIHQIADYAGYAIASPTIPASELAPRVGEKWASALSQLSVAGHAPIALAILGWALVGALLLSCARRAPAITLLGASFLIFLSPTSSIVPLSEMVNEHRPYLPDTNLLLLGSLALFLLTRAIGRRHGVSVYAAAILALAIPLTLATRQRNLVFLDEYTYWRDCAEKDPLSGRAQLNFGLELWQAKNGRPRNIAEAERRFREAVRLWPGWFFGHVNLAMLLDELGRRDESNREYDLAVECGPASAIPAYYRGLSRLKHHDIEGAIHDLEIAVHQASVKTRERAALAEAYLDAGRSEDARAQIEAGEVIDPGAFAYLRARLPH